MGRREQRAELEVTWMVWDAKRPIRKADMEADDRDSELVTGNVRVSELDDFSEWIGDL